MKLISYSTFFRVGAVIALVWANFGARASAQVIYQQTFDAPVGANGDVYFTTSGVYNGITDGSSSGGITTGGSFAGGPLTADGKVVNAFGSITAPQSGPFFLYNGTTAGFGPYNDLVYSTAGTTITVVPGKVYTLSFYLAQQSSIASPAIVPSANGVVLGAAATPTLSGPFQQFQYQWAANSSTVVLTLVNQTPDGTGNDFGLDTIQFIQTNVDVLPSLAGLDPNQTAIAQNLLSNGGISNPILDAVSLAAANNPGSFGSILNQLSPEQFARFTSVTAFNDASYETEQMDNYLASQRRGPNGTFAGGNGGIDASGLTLNDPSYDPNLAMVHSRLLAWNPTAPAGTVSDIADSTMAGVDMKSMAAPESSDPWNCFVRGNVILAQGFSQADVSHFDDNTESVVVGADYRLTPNFLVGLTAGYAHTDATLDSNQSSATVDSYSPGLYASYADKGWYANLNGDYIHNAYTQDRVIPFLSQTATSAPEGNEGLANLDGGYDFRQGHWTYGPVAGVQYVHLSVDGYTEAGSVADLHVNGDDTDSLRGRMGGRVSYAFSQYGVIFTPHLDATWQHEFMDQGRGITSQFDGAGLGSFTVRTASPQRDFALIDAGMDMEITHSTTFFVNDIVQAGQDNYFGEVFQAGLKIGF